MNLLAIETSGPLGSVALAAEGRPSREVVLADRLRHEGGLAPAVRRLLEEEGLALREIQGLAVGLGPGSYTGIRIGVTFAKMLAWSAGFELRGFAGFEVLAREAAAGDGSTPVAVMTRAHAGRVYGAVYDLSGPTPRALVPLAVHEPNALLARTPEGTRLFADEPTRESVDAPWLALPERVRATGLIELARASRRAGVPADDPETLLPLYLQAAAPER